MARRKLSEASLKRIEEILGYLNFSSGAADPRFLANLNAVFAEEAAARARARGKRSAATPAWERLQTLLATRLDELEGTSDAFRHLNQARAALALVFEHLLPAYRYFHGDLLFHQSDETLFSPYFLGRAFEAVLRQGPPWEESERIVRGAITGLNDFIGHRPVPVLRTAQKIQPYPHEWVAPVPLWIRGAGAADGRYKEVVEQALQILADAPPEVHRQAQFNVEWLDELAFDPRAYDFDHPANKRPNYHFGQWDPHQIDNSGRYRRFVVQQVTLDAILDRIPTRNVSNRGEWVYEAAAVLAGTMLMGSGVSGWGPGAYDSSVTLANLMPRIAAYRDEFYQRLIARVEGDHGERLRREAQTLKQPFAGARQHLNQQLARLRASQLQHTRLALFYAWIGYTDAAMAQADVVPVASARMECQIRCLITGGHLKLDRGQLNEAAAVLPDVEDLLRRGIECGALADPWSILGFAGQFSVFPAVENSVPDHRVDELIELVSQIFGLYTRLLKEAAARGQIALAPRLSEGMERLAAWWDKYGSTELTDIRGFSGRSAFESAVHVAAALRAWQEGGTAAGDVAFWRERIDAFQSAKAYALVVEALLEKRDMVASMALLIQWLSRVDEIPLQEPEYSFHDLAIGWMDDLLAGEEGRNATWPLPADEAAKRWPLARKMLDYIEANAEGYGQAPKLQLDGGLMEDEDDWPEDDDPLSEDEALDEAEELLADHGEGEGDDGPNELFAAAYEDVTYRDSTDDGIESEIAEGGGGYAATDFELGFEAERIAERLDFLTTQAWLWRMAATAFGAGGAAAAEQQAVFGGWLAQATKTLRGLGELLASVGRFHIAPPRGTPESLMEYDRRRSIRESMLEGIITATVELADAASSLRGALDTDEGPIVEPWERAAERVMRGIYRGSPADVRTAWPDLVVALVQQPLLYVSLAKGGDAAKIVASRSLQRVLCRLLAYLPRLGMLEETYHLLETIQGMEQNHPVGPGAITEFDRLFDIACKGIVRSLVVSSEGWSKAKRTPGYLGNDADLELINRLERAVEALVHCWHGHSRRVRLSVLESVADDDRWQILRRFVEFYGADIFSQHFMNMGNLRAILHQGVARYLRQLQEEPDGDVARRLLADLDGPISLAEAAFLLDMAIEAVVENYSGYIDYNSTTTQSDRGEMLYTLLDFLRLQASYNRIAWNLRPVIVAHEVLVRSGREEAAEIWRLAVRERTHDIAEQHLKQYGQLTRQYGMRLPSVFERLEERFVRPMIVDQLRALVGPAIEELRGDGAKKAFARLQEGVAPLLEEPGGVGFEMPPWLEALETEVEDYRSGPSEEEQPVDPHLAVPEVRLTAREVDRQIQALRRRSSY